MGTISFELDARLGLRIATLSGDIEDGQLCDAFRRLTRAADFDPRLHDLVDLRAVTRLDVTANGLRELIGLFRGVYRHNKNRRVAIVAATDSAFGMARMYQLLRGVEPPEDIRVFRDADAALAWLGAAAAPGTSPARD